MIFLESVFHFFNIRVIHQQTFNTLTINFKNFHEILKSIEPKPFGIFWFLRKSKRLKNDGEDWSEIFIWSLFVSMCYFDEYRIECGLTEEDWLYIQINFRTETNTIVIPYLTFFHTILVLYTVLFCTFNYILIKKFERLILRHVYSTIPIRFFIFKTCT